MPARDCRFIFLMTKPKTDLGVGGWRPDHLAPQLSAPALGHCGLCLPFSVGRAVGRPGIPFSGLAPQGRTTSLWGGDIRTNVTAGGGGEATWSGFLC